MIVLHLFYVYLFITDTLMDISVEPTALSDLGLRNEKASR